MKPKIDITMEKSIGRSSGKGAGFWIVLGIIVLFIGGAIWYYDTHDTPYKGIVQRNITVFLCCVPAVISAIILFAFGLFGSVKKEEIKVAPIEPSIGLPTCKKCGSIRLNHKVDGRIQCNECGYEW
ncbi:MAG: hypothetical protein AB1779_01770 [Candidatus Thermoplasmatota archaeon]